MKCSTNKRTIGIFKQLTPAGRFINSDRHHYMLFTIFFLLITNQLFAQKATINKLPKLNYSKYELKTEGDTLCFYLSVSSLPEKLPLIVYIQGSGTGSLFAERNGRIVPTSGHMSWYDVGQNKYRILIVEKPGVQYLQTGESQVFDRKFSLESWSERIAVAINYVIQEGYVDKTKILLAGHSEGGVVAARVANLMKSKISHVAIMAGEGPPQLYSLYKLAENGSFFNSPEHNMPTAEQRIQYVTDIWKDILAHPASTDKILGIHLFKVVEFIENVGY